MGSINFAFYQFSKNPDQDLMMQIEIMKPGSIQ